ncbi:MAG: hypothetical protein RMJ98_02120 [Myxococcales bacterium]|nr:hypothetical protein [Polyangiaceae bacterium]MDW8248085.1 hypothetical protein [Myxococcales bacterium]
MAASASQASAIPSGPPTGGVTTWNAPESRKGCPAYGRELDQNLAYGLVNVAARGKEMSAIRFLRTGNRGEGQLAFGGYDLQTRSVSTSYGLGKARFLRTWIFPRREDWVVFWFDSKGLVFTHTGWTVSVSKIARFAAISVEEADRVAILRMTPEGPLLGIAPLGMEPTSQLGLFTFLPGEQIAEEVKAIGATHQAVRPVHPAVVASSERYYLAWQDTLGDGKPSVIALTSFDSNGRELESHRILSTPGITARQPALALHGDTVLAAWVEGGNQGDEVIVQAFHKDLQPLEGARRIDRGTHPTLVTTRLGAALLFLRGTDPKAGNPALVHVNARGIPAGHGLLLVSENTKDSVEAPPALTVLEEDWLGVVFTFSGGMRAQMRTLKLDCLTAP